jgi:phenylacetate-coenzyme A ligase PaaK-like adenylate-forming protein
VAETLHDPRRPSRTLSAAAGVDELAVELARFGPDVLTGYASVLVALAERQLAGDLAITPVQVFTGGERLARAARERITAAWGTEPFDQYLTTEAGFVAIECPEHRGLHVMDEDVVIEVVDGAGEAVRSGEAGERVLMTVLRSRTLPLVRYELEDVATLDPAPCSCGRLSPRLSAVAGAPRRLLRLPRRDGGDVEVHPVVVTSVMDALPAGAWQVVHDAGRLTVLVAGWRSDQPIGTVTPALRSALTAAGVADVSIEVVAVEELRRTDAGKAALVISEGP